MLKSYHTEFFTATILHWQKLLQDDYLKQILVDSLQWLVKENRCFVYAFVIINHIHLLWKIADNVEREMVQGAFLSFTAHAFKKYLQQHNASLLEAYAVDAKDRAYQFWQRTPMVKEVWSEKFFLQKLEYIHHNPCQPHWLLTPLPEDYKWSSAMFYEKNIIEPYRWLTHYKD